MKKIILVLAAASLAIFSTQVFAKEPKFILLISEQNIEGPQRAWWASEIDLSATENNLAEKLTAHGFTIIEPSKLTKKIKKEKAFRMVDLSDEKAIDLGNLSSADYVIMGKAIASSGGNVPQSTLISCFANITAKIIRVKDGESIAYLDASGNSAHMDKVSGGTEALRSASTDLAVKIINALNKEGGN